MAETGKRGWGRASIFQSPLKGCRKIGKRNPGQHGHAAGGATNTPVGCLLVRGSQCVGMSIKKDAARPFGLGTFFVVAVQDENRDKQRQGITIMGVSCLLIFLTRRGILGSVQQIGI